MYEKVSGPQSHKLTAAAKLPRQFCKFFCSGKVLDQHGHTGLGGREAFQFFVEWGFFVCLFLIAESRAFRIEFFIQLHF